MATEKVDTRYAAKCMLVEKWKRLYQTANSIPKRKQIAYKIERYTRQAENLRPREE